MIQTSLPSLFTVQPMIIQECRGNIPSPFESSLFNYDILIFKNCLGMSTSLSVPVLYDENPTGGFQLTYTGPCM